MRPASISSESRNYPNCVHWRILVYYAPRCIMRVITRRATMLAGDRSPGVIESKSRRSRGEISPASISSE